MPDLSRYVQLIKTGEIVAFPTETVYGLGADAWNPSAIQKVFETKGRPSDNPLIVHISEKNQVYDFASEVTEAAKILIKKFWPGPLTLVLNKKPKVLDLITAGLHTVALRMPDHPYALEFISQTGPLVAPSANKSGRPSPTKAEHVLEDFGKDFPVIDGGATEVGLESTVLDLTTGVPCILRPGKIGKEELESVLNTDVKTSDKKGSNTPKSPGQKYSHYKPKAEVRWLDDDDPTDNPSFLYLLIARNAPDTSNIIHYNGNFTRFTSELYDRFRQADIEGFDSVVIESIENKEHSIIPALLNRIRKAIR